jgi:hypothetical protein
VILVTVFMTVPMTAWMSYRGMLRRAIVEMPAVMPIVAAGLLALGWLGALPMGSLALVDHGLMMPAMLIPMLARLDLHTGRAGHENARRHPSAA